MKISTLLLLLYILSPIDLLPDYLLKPFGLGHIDDLLLFLVYLYFNNQFFNRLINQLLFRKNFSIHNKTAEEFQQTREDKSENSQKQSENSQNSDKKYKSPWQILEINENAGEAEIREAYKKKCLLYHPDKVAHLGEKLQKLALEEFQEIEKAFHTLKKQRKF